MSDLIEKAEAAIETAQYMSWPNARAQAAFRVFVEEHRRYCESKGYMIGFVMTEFCEAHAIPTEKGKP